MDSCEAIIAIDSHWINHLAATLWCETTGLIQLDLDVGQFFDADILVESESSFIDLTLVILGQTSCVNSLLLHAE